MFSINKFKVCADKTYKVIDIYDMLIRLIVNDFNKDNMRFKLILMEIITAIDQENNQYNKLIFDEVKEFTNVVREYTKENGNSLYDVRINSQLAIVYDKLSGNVIKNDDLFPTLDKNLEFSIIDLINSKIAIDVHKLLLSKLNSISLIDEKSKDYVNKIRSLNMEHSIYKLSLHNLSERLLIALNFDFTDLPDIDLSIIETKLFHDRGIFTDLRKAINNKIYDLVLSMIEEFKHIDMNYNEYESIYDNLFYVTQLEVLFSYLEKNQLESIYSCLDGIFSIDKIVMDNVKRLVRNRIGNF